MSVPRHLPAVLRVELLGLLRDRRALFSAFVLPMLLYPLMFLGQGWLETFSRETLEARTIRIALDLRAAPPELAARATELLALEQPIELATIDASELLAQPGALEANQPDASEEERASVANLCAGRFEVLVVARALADKPYLALRPYYDGTSDLANEARGRVDHALGLLYRELEAQRIGAVLGADPGRGLEIEPIDVASAADTSGAALGRLLPLIAVIVLLSGGSYAALAAFAGERESGTLETLLVQPVPALSIAGAKFLAVLLTGIVTLLLNAGSVLVCSRFGLGSLPGTSSDAGLVLGAGRLASGAFVFLPAAILLCAVLCLVCGRARTFREGQQVLLPLMLVAILPTLFATQQDIALDPLLAAVPLAGPSLALRDALRGELRLGVVTWMFVANMGWAALAVARLARLIDAEKLLQSRDNEQEARARKAQSRGALRWGWLGVFAVYVVGGSLQSWSLVWGLVATLWILLFGLALLCARGLARPPREPARTQEREPLAHVLGLRRPAPWHLLGALLLAPALAQAARVLFAWQQDVLPLPSSMQQTLVEQQLEGLGPFALFCLLALSPAICEELFFRGAVLTGLRRDLPAAQCIVWQALLFGAVHASIYRFLPTALLGALLAALTLRARSVWPAIVLHCAYNGLLVLGESDVRLADPRWAWLAFAGLALVAWPGSRAARLQPA